MSPWLLILAGKPSAAQPRGKWWVDSSTVAGDAGDGPDVSFIAISFSRISNIFPWDVIFRVLGVFVFLHSSAHVRLCSRVQRIARNEPSAKRALLTWRRYSRGLLRYCENFAEGSFPESEQLIERWDKCGPPCLEDTNPATLQHFDGDQLKCSKLDIVKNNWNICVASRKIWQFYTFCCIFRHFALSFGLDIVYWRRKWNPRHNSGCLEEGTEKFFMILCCHAACFRTRCIVHFAFSLNKIKYFWKGEFKLKPQLTVWLDLGNFYFHFQSRLYLTTENLIFTNAAQSFQVSNNSCCAFCKHCENVQTLWNHSTFCRLLA